jgi:hypothetical protein
MWLSECELRAIGFRRRSTHYWQCERRFGLPSDGYLSVFADGECAIADSIGDTQPSHIEVSAFHVTFVLGVDNIHFYYHEHAENVWEPGGHTSRFEIERHGVEPRILRADADTIAELVVAALHGTLLPRE